MTVNLSARAAIGGTELRVTTSASLEFRDGGSTGCNLVGYASVTERGYTIQDWLGEYEEIVRTGAFGKTLKDGADVRLLLNHEGIPLARTKSGTLNLREITDPKDDPLERGLTGLYVDAPNLDPESPLVQSIRSAMKRGDLDEMSFGFQVTKQLWSPDYTQRDILEVRLFDVSVVTYPANDATSAVMRSLSAHLDALTDDQAREALDRLQRRFAAPQAPALRWYEAEALALDLPPQQ